MSPTNIRPWPPNPRYSVSDCGDVYGTRGQRLTLQDKDGYRAAYVAVNGKKRKCPVHQLVLETFIGPRPDGHETLHRNGIRSDNRLSNLRYGTRSENVRDALRHGTHHMAKRAACKYGHEFTPENTYLNPPRRQGGGPYRVCRKCEVRAKARKVELQRIRRQRDRKAA